MKLTCGERPGTLKGPSVSPQAAVSAQITDGSETKRALRGTVVEGAAILSELADHKIARCIHFAAGSAMSELESLLSSLRPDIESQLKPHLRGFFRGIVRSYLPQVWAFKTEIESGSLTVSAEGKVRVSPGVSRHCDVLITWSHQQLTAALRTRDRTQVPPGAPPSVEFKTRRGKTAFSFLKSRFGL
jgi:hypothetical protein